MRIVVYDGTLTSVEVLYENSLPQQQYEAGNKATSSSQNPVQLVSLADSSLTSAQQAQLDLKVHKDYEDVQG